ncbi:MAG: CHAD domain-containing protein [Ginsengibacter sp.]
MKQKEMSEFIKNSFKNIKESFHKAITNFDAEDIRRFRREVRKLKVFLHLLSMESEDGLSYHTTKRMKKIYGYLGIIHDFQLQLKKVNESAEKSSGNDLVNYLNMLERELGYWKELSKEFIDPDYNFFNDQREIIAKLPNQLTMESIKRFIHYTLYELQSMSGRQDEEALNNIRKCMEDIYYNLPFLKPYLVKQQSILFDEKELSECLFLFGDFHIKCTNTTLLQIIRTDDLDENERQFLKQMEIGWLREKKKIHLQLAAKMDAMHIGAGSLNELSLHE